MDTYGPILKTELFKRRAIGAPRLRATPGVALVLVGRGAGLSVLPPGDRLTLGESWLGGYTHVHWVDMGVHLLERTLALTARGDVGDFTATFAMTCRVTDPAAIVRQGIADAGDLLWRVVWRHAQTVTSEFAPDEVSEAEHAIAERLSGLVLHPAFDTQVTVRLALAQEARSYEIRRRERAYLEQWVEVKQLRELLDSAHAQDPEEAYAAFLERLTDLLAVEGSESIEAEPGRLPPKVEAPVPVHILARIDPEIAVDQVTSVQVIVSREQLPHVERLAEASGQASADPERTIQVEVIGRVNLRVEGRDRREVPIPPRGQPRLLLFDVRATHMGDAELWVVVRQGPLPLLTLVLRPRLRNVSPSTESMPQAVAVGNTVIGSWGEPPLTVLRIHEERHGRAVVYRYDLDAPELGFTRPYASRLIEQNRDVYVRSLFRRIEAVWVASGEDAAAFQEQLRAFGAELLDELVPVELQRDLWVHRDQLAHIVVLSTEPFIPWELVHLKDPDVGRLPVETWFLAQLGLVRWLWQPQRTGRHSNVRLPVRLRVRPGRAHYVIPDYPDMAWRLVAPPAEQAFLERLLGATPVVPHQAEVLALLRDPDAFDLLHFAGHGRAASDSIADAELLLQGRMERGTYLPEPLPVAVVRQNFRADGSSPIVILNACQTGRLGYQLASIGGFAEAFVGGGAGAFVSSLWSVGDIPARVFVEALYEQLLAGESMAAAVRAARERARAAGDATWLSYTVYAHPRARLVRADEPDGIQAGNQRPPPLSP